MVAISWRLAWRYSQRIGMLHICDAILANTGYYFDSEVCSSRPATKQD